MRVRKGRSVGAILAGGGSRRFGAVKGLADLDGRTLIRRVLDAHREALPEAAVVTDRRDLYRDLHIPMISDLHVRSGPLAGLYAALEWARARGATGVCCTPCDAPFVSGAYLRLLLEGSTEGAPLAVVPESAGPLGYEPLFGWYATDLSPIIGARLAAGRTAVHQFVDRLDRVLRVPLERVAAAGDPSLLFMNVNTPDDLERARLVLTSSRPCRRLPPGEPGS